MRQGALGGSLLPCFGGVFLLSVWCQSAPQAGTLRWARFLIAEKETPAERPQRSKNRREEQGQGLHRLGTI